MTSPQPDQPTILDYAPPARRQPGILISFLFCSPGLVCWYELFATNFYKNWDWHFLPLLSSWISIKFMGVIWAVAVSTAFGSIAYYWHRPKRWYVILRLTSNILGLLFSCWFPSILMTFHD